MEQPPSKSRGELRSRASRHHSDEQLTSQPSLWLNMTPQERLECQTLFLYNIQFRFFLPLLLR